MSPGDSVPLREFRKGIHDFAQEFVGDYRPVRQSPYGPKIVHDPLWGTIRLHPWEVELLDLPLFQRLRQIHQTSLVSYVFPGCNHTRFEHTLGVVQQAQRLIDAVNLQCDPDRKWFDPATVRNLRLAALFHDCGHSCFSHITEDLYEACPDMRAYLESAEEKGGHPHETLGALILRSEPVRAIITEIERKHGIKLDVEMAARWITGNTSESTGGRRLYETQVINGPFDADKLDYIFRDAHYSGVPVGLDLDRLWASCTIEETEGGDRVLALRQASIAPLEQVLFSKINLFAIVYQHPKVRAAERMFQSIIEAAKANPEAIYFNISDRVLDLNRATDYLRLTDEVFFAEALRRRMDDPLHKKIHDIRYRRLFVRALTISNDTIGKGCEGGYVQLRKLNQRGPETYGARRDLARLILDASGLAEKIDIGDVWVDLPSDPSFGEVDRTFVCAAAGKLRKVSELFPIHYWSELFQKHKWRGHVFCPSEYQQQIHEAALEVFKSEFDLTFKASAGECSHVPDPKATCGQ